MRIYLASGWFTPEQEKDRLVVLNILKYLEVDFYSPKDQRLFVKGKTDMNEILSINLIEIRKADFIVASPGSESKNRDTGTIWECGYAFACKIPIVYYWPSTEAVNLMLSASAYFVATTEDKLRKYLEDVLDSGYAQKIEWEGDIE